MTFEEQYKDALAFFQKAKGELVDGNYDVSLFQVRKALENIVKRMCEWYAIDVKDSTGKTVSLLDLIDQLGNRGIISENDVHLLHQIRSLGNRGVHNDIPTTHRDAQAAINKFSQALAVFNHLYNKEQAKVNSSKAQITARRSNQQEKTYRSKLSRTKSTLSKLRKWLTFVVIVVLLIFSGWICIKKGYIDAEAIAAIDEYIFTKSTEVIAAFDDSFDIETIETIDPFKYIELEFSGLSSKATAIIKQSERHEFFNSLDKYTLARNNALSNGDIVKISIDRKVSREALKQGYILSQTERTYEVNGLPEAVLLLSDIPAQALEIMREDCETFFWSKLDEEGLSSAKLNVNLEYMGSYLYTNHNRIESNVLHIVYQVDVSQDENTEVAEDKFTYYYCAMYEKLINTDGVISKTKIEICNPYFTYRGIGYFGYQMLDELYKTTPLCQSKGMGYRCEAVVANESVIYTGRLPAPYYPDNRGDIPEGLQSEMITVAQEKIEEYAATWKYPKTFKGMECLDIIPITHIGSTGNTVFLLFRVDVQPLTKHDNFSNFYYFVAFKDVYKKGYESWNALLAPLTPKRSFSHDVYGVGLMEFLRYNGYETIEAFEKELQAFKSGKLLISNFTH